MADKKPSMQWYPGDWLKDPCVGQCSPQTRGVWVDMLSLMHENGRTGKLQGTYESLARVCRCSIEQFKKTITELKDTNTATVTVRNKKITIINRRMNKEYKERESNKNRQLKFRKKSQPDLLQENNEEVTSYSSSSTSLSKESTKENIFYIPDWIPLNLWEEWMGIRKKKRAINSVRAMESLIKCLEKIKNSGRYTVEYAVKKAIEKSWKGLELEWLDNLKENKNAKSNLNTAAKSIQQNQPL